MAGSTDLQEITPTGKSNAHYIGAADALAVEMPSMARRPTNCINKGQELDSA